MDIPTPPFAIGQRVLAGNEPAVISGLRYRQSPFVSRDWHWDFIVIYDRTLPNGDAIYSHSYRVENMKAL